MKKTRKLIELAEESLYGTKQISLPTPQCIVFYNGEQNAPEEQTLKLSDAFENKEKEFDEDAISQKEKRCKMR